MRSFLSEHVAHKRGQHAALAMLLFLAGCAGFRQLAADLSLMERAYLVSGAITNAPDIGTDVLVVIFERTADGKVVSADVTRTGELGTFGFVVEGRTGYYLAAYADRDGSGRYEPGEPAWIHTDASGSPAPLVFAATNRTARVRAEVSPAVVIPPGFVDSVREFGRGRPLAEVIRGWSVAVSLGEIADLDEPRFSASVGEEGLWKPASFPLESGVGIFFLERYDPDKIPVLFVYGIMGSPQNWRAFFDNIDRERYQPWFYFYPTGRRIDEMADWLNRGIETLHEHYGFDRLHVVAHSMGGLVSRAFLLENVLEDGNEYIDKFVTISTPWGGHDAAKAGVEQAPSVVPSWRDLAPGSDFLQALFDESLRGRVDYHLLFGYRGSRSLIMPPSNDGTVSVVSELRPEAQAEAVRLYGFDDDHTEILADPAVIETVETILAGQQNR